jgi:hypothetical protein
MARRGRGGTIQDQSLRPHRTLLKRNYMESFLKVNAGSQMGRQAVEAVGPTDDMVVPGGHVQDGAARGIANHLAECCAGRALGQICG